MNLSRAKHVLINHVQSDQEDDAHGIPFGICSALLRDAFTNRYETHFAFVTCGCEVNLYVRLRRTIDCTSQRKLKLAL